MKVCNLFLAGVLTIGSRAGSVPPQADPPMVNFNPFGKPGCSEDGQGFYTLTQTQNSVCYVFSPPFPTIVQSAFITDIISGCVVYVYTDTACTLNEATLDKGVENCYDEPAGMASYRLVCGRRYPIPHSTRTGLSASPSQTW